MVGGEFNVPEPSLKLSINFIYMQNQEKLGVGGGLKKRRKKKQNTYKEGKKKQAPPDAKALNSLTGKWLHAAT